MESGLPGVGLGTTWKKLMVLKNSRFWVCWYVAVPWGLSPPQPTGVCGVSASTGLMPGCVPAYGTLKWIAFHQPPKPFNAFRLISLKDLLKTELRDDRLLLIGENNQILYR